MMLRVSLCLLALCACGRTGRHPLADSNGGNGGDGGAGSSGTSGTPAASGTHAMGGSAGEANCLYPLEGLDIEPSSDKPASPLALTSPYPVSGAPPRSRFAAACDVNGDAVSDLLLHDEQQSPPRFRLLLTSPPPGIFDFVESDCTALRQLPGGRLFLRDLDGDGVEDFVVGTNEGVQAFLNRQEGLVPVLNHDHRGGGLRVPLINVALADLNGDRLLDLVAAFDSHVKDTTAPFQVLLQAFLQQPDGRFERGESLGALFGEGRGTDGTVYLGYLTAGQFVPGETSSVLLVAQTPRTEGFQLFQSRFDGAEPVPQAVAFEEQTSEVFVVPRPQGHALVLEVGERHFALVDRNGDPLFAPTVVALGELQFADGPWDELGGGSEHPRRFVYDIERDGDLDFVERDVESRRVAVHVNHGNERFDAAQILDVSVGGTAENPFVQIGPLAGIIGFVTSNSDETAVYGIF